MAENLRLVCEGSETLYFGSHPPTVKDKVIDIEVTDDFIRLENKLINNDMSSDEFRKKFGSFTVNNYKKTTDLIEFSEIYSLENNDKSTRTYVGVINRFTAEITITKHNFLGERIFSGTCKKGERTF